MISKLKAALIATAVSTSVFSAGQASADVRGYTANTVAQVRSGAQFLDLNTASGYQPDRWVYLPIRHTAVFFNAECSVAGTGHSTWLNIDIEVRRPNGTLFILTPSDGDNALCTSNGTAGYDGWVSAETNGAFYAGQAGWYRFRVRGNAPGYRIDDLSLIVMQ